MRVWLEALCGWGRGWCERHSVVGAQGGQGDEVGVRDIVVGEHQVRLSVLLFFV